MNLSQDEINSLMTVNPSDEGDAAESSEIMSPEAIAAMLDSAAGAPAAEDDGSVEIMSPEDIAVMLDSSASADVAADGAADSAADIMSPEAIASMLDSATDGTAADDPSTDDADSTLDDLISRAESEAASVQAPSGKAEELNAKEGMLSAEEIDILGEVGNISMGAVATTMYSLLDRRVSITTPRVYVYETKDVLSIYHVPFVVATIEYVEGISGTNLLVLKVNDAALITDLLMGGDGKVEEPIELNEMHLSAMSEIMNQMMGASSTSLSKLLHTPINISPPKSSQVDVGFDVTNLLGGIDMVTKISFDMEIEGLLKSELIQLIPYDLSKKFAEQFMEVGMGIPSDNSDKSAASEQPPTAQAPPPPAAPVAAPGPAPPPAAAPAIEQPPAPQQPPPPQYQAPYPQDPYQQAPYQQPYPPPYPQAPYPQAPYPAQYPPPVSAQGRLVDVHPMQFQPFDAPGPVGESRGMDLVYNIPLQVTVELGKTKKEISEILEFNTGTVIVLDKIAGDPVEIVVNGKLLARGEVVVIDENYGVRITDIING